jgi:hypothetical protein
VVANPMGYRISNWLQVRPADNPVSVKYENAAFDPALTVKI